MTPRNSRALGQALEMLANERRSMVAARLLLCAVCNTPVRHFSHSSANRIVSIGCVAMVASNVIESGWKSSWFRMSSLAELSTDS